MSAATRRAALQRLAAEHAIQPNARTTAGEDLLDNLEHPGQIKQWCAVTQSSDSGLRYLYPRFESREQAREGATLYMRDATYDETPLEIVDLDTGEREEADLSVRWARPLGEAEPTGAPRTTLAPEERAQRLLDGREGWRSYLRDTGGGIVVCEVAKADDEDAPYAWVTGSGEETKPYQVGIYLPQRWEEPAAGEEVGEPDLESHVFAALAAVEAKLESLLAEGRQLYETSSDGQGALERWARRLCVARFVHHRRCESCEINTPHLGGVCVACGTANKEAGA